MSNDWRQYQNDVAEAFRSLGATVEVEARVTGARGTHDIDVWATFKQFGNVVTWMAECKLWQTSIPKEKVVNLYQIVQDVGADRAFLFSESGFQAGAIKSTQHTNLTLTNLAEFKSNAESDLFEFRLVSILKEVEKLHSEVKGLWLDERGGPLFIPGMDFDALVSLDGGILYFKNSLQKALTRQFPLSFIDIVGSEVVLSNDCGALLQNAEASLNKAWDAYKTQLNLNERLFGPFDRRLATLVNAVEALCVVGENCIFGDNRDDTHVENLRFDAAEKMKSIHNAAQAVYATPDNTVRAKVRSLVKLLVDTLYLYLTLPVVAREEWNNAQDQVKKILCDLLQPRATQS